MSVPSCEAASRALRQITGPESRGTMAGIDPLSGRMQRCALTLDHPIQHRPAILADPAV
ncbi:hypothetical protein GCM10007890_29210 [Methylobacterium tardum]|uniref:Uncharacterized protein n=1 Tax=Methylobacterium tardum TaxID=374432 RepID=A0AA37TMN8_9HYPH|nr:hypothetical protein GCM10007890_29210 [Methylobacterium tardum]